MQERESKTRWHFWTSFAKSCVRILGAFTLIGGDLVAAGLCFILAELLGIAEEF